MEFFVPEDFFQIGVANCPYMGLAVLHSDTLNASGVLPLLLRILEVSGSNFGPGPAILTEVLHGFPHFLQQMKGQYLNLCHNSFLPYPLQSILSYRKSN
jgi:hypothetical protein